MKIININKLLYSLINRISLNYYFSKQVKKMEYENQYNTFPVQIYDIGQRLDRYLKGTEIGWISAQKYLRNQDILVKTLKGQFINRQNYKFQEGDQILIRQGKQIQEYFLGSKTVRMVDLTDSQLKATFQKITLFDNKNITIFNKPGNYSVQGGDEPKKNLFSLMSARYKKDMIYIAHRLDKPTTGLVMVCKNLKTAQLIGKALEQRQGLSKYYLAMTEGQKIREQRGLIRCNVQWSPKHKAVISQYLTGPTSQQTITYYDRIDQQQLNDISWRNLLCLKLISGKKHQLRCHLSQYLQNPILNDKLYYGRQIKEFDNPNKQIYLHAYQMQISDQQVLQKVFEIKSEMQKLEYNHLGKISIQNGVLKIHANLPSIWKPFQKVVQDSDLQFISKRMAVFEQQIARKRLMKKITTIQ